ncbi:hypothetical protein [Pseudoxanthomonas sangjuensis]
MKMEKFPGYGLWVAAFFVVPATAMAADTIKIAKVVPYQDVKAVESTNLSKCDWNRKLSQLIVKKSRGRVEAVDAELASVGGKTLELVITMAHTAGGGGISGPKFGRVRGELRDGDKLLGNFSIKRATARPFTFSVCGPLDKVAEALSGDIVDWLENPTIDPNAGKADGSDEDAQS